MSVTGAWWSAIRAVQRCDPRPANAPPADWPPGRQRPAPGDRCDECCTCTRSGPQSAHCAPPGGPDRPAPGQRERLAFPGRAAAA
eukprot:9849586-Lingulodinium_polyedra.AAC.1